MSPATRRDFIKSTAVAAAGVMTAAQPKKVHGANERLRVAFIGVGNRGGQLLDRTLPNEDVEVAVLCDVYQPFLDQWSAKVGGDVSTTKDFREVLDRDDIDAVFVASPDHWHALHTIQACEAGKDVYIEKPLSYTVVEGQKMIEAARKHDRVVQCGLHRRSSKMYADLAEYVQGNNIGKVTLGRAYRLSNMFPDGFGSDPDTDPPETLDWDMWLGPRPYRQYNPNIAPYKFRWWKDYSSQLGNWGVHYFDLIRWLVGEEAPTSVVALGGKYAVQDDRTIPDTLEVIYEFASGRLLVFGQLEANQHSMLEGAEVELRGTQGTLLAGGRGYSVVPEKGGQFQSNEARMEPVEVKSEDGDVTVTHIRNFL
ncbi:MAG: Gfo/Idh/MocA family oxidoreductase, partial [Candidatus Omnitrophica bacterium]|nr:Gfo/Idh/MocA family oxidoreductase [Candidatus Omnitrophota bacterium]